MVFHRCGREFGNYSGIRISRILLLTCIETFLGLRSMSHMTHIHMYAFCNSIRFLLMVYACIIVHVCKIMWLWMPHLFVTKVHVLNKCG